MLTTSVAWFGKVPVQGREVLMWEECTKLRRPVAMSVLAGVCTLLLLGGCSDSSKAQYTSQMRTHVAGALREVDSLDSPDAARFRQVAARLRSESRRIEQIRPPDDVRSLHERLSTDFQAVADMFIELAPMADQIREHPDASRSIQRQYSDKLHTLAKIGNDLDAVDSSYRKHGYDLGLSKVA